jgi:hypothetical protein
VSADGPWTVVNQLPVRQARRKPLVRPVAEYPTSKPITSRADAAMSARHYRQCRGFGQVNDTPGGHAPDDRIHRRVGGERAIASATQTWPAGAAADDHFRASRDLRDGNSSDRHRLVCH